MVFPRFESFAIPNVVGKASLWWIHVVAYFGHALKLFTIFWLVAVENNMGNTWLYLYRDAQAICTAFKLCIALINPVSKGLIIFLQSKSCTE